MCSSHGTCVDVNKCTCYPGYGGADCSVPFAGYVYSVGKNDIGQFGNNYYTDSATKEFTWYPLYYGTMVQVITAGVNCTFAITTSGMLLAWGRYVIEYCCLTSLVMHTSSLEQVLMFPHSLEFLYPLCHQLNLKLLVQASIILRQLQRMLL